MPEQQEPQKERRQPRRPLAAAPSARRQVIGSMLRGYREAHGYKLEEAALILECDRSKISRVETGERGIRPRELRELLTEYGADERTKDTLALLACPRGAAGWWKAYAHVLPDAYLDFAVMEAAAARVLAYAPGQVPGLLQEPGYATAVAAAGPFTPGGLEHLTAEAAMARQEAVLDGRDAPDLAFVIGEAALHQQVGSGPRVMRGQLARLEDLSSGERSSLSLRVLPYAAGAAAAAVAGPFTVLQFATTPGLGLVHLPGPGGGTCLAGPAAVAAYTRTFDYLSCHALTPELTTRRFRQLARHER